MARPPRCRSFLITALAAFALAACTTRVAPPPRAQSPSPSPGEPKAARRGDRIDDSVHVTLGVPVDKDPSDEVLLDRREYVLSYSEARHAANWVAWRVRSEDLGDWDRQNDFRPDDALPDGFVRIGARAFARSGYDRGHLCPSADRTASAEANSLTFLMSNMHPQKPRLNRGPWAALEEQERALARLADKDVYVVAGGVFDEHPARVGEVAVPYAEFKIVVSLGAGQGAADVTLDTPIYAVVMPNDDDLQERSWESFTTSVDRIERLTGYDFLARVDDRVEPALEALGERVSN